MSSLNHLLQELELLEKELDSPGYYLLASLGLMKKGFDKDSGISPNKFAFGRPEWLQEFDKYYFSNKTDRLKFCHRYLARLKSILSRVERSEENRWDSNFTEEIKFLINYIEEYIQKSPKRKKRYSGDEFLFADCLSEKGKSVIEPILKIYGGGKLKPGDYASILFSMIEEKLFTPDYISILLDRYPVEFHNGFTQKFSRDLLRDSMSKAVKSLRETRNLNNSIYSERISPYQDTIRNLY